ncbi:plasmid partition protein ParG [Rhizobium sp. LjRoot30]|uniref:plasmid partition protein ParG n=1 Tax=Rhizobium sp. LjRoot30 TaxID=3342320 RepID=UPI003ECF9B63
MKKTVMKMPGIKAQPSAADQWVGAPTADVSEAPKAAEVIAMPAPTETVKRLTIDMPESLHRRIKFQCISRGLKMSDAIRELLDREFPA